jgi:hypothetical protein
MDKILLIADISYLYQEPVVQNLGSAIHRITARWSILFSLNFDMLKLNFLRCSFLNIFVQRLKNHYPTNG